MKKKWEEFENDGFEEETKPENEDFEEERGELNPEEIVPEENEEEETTPENEDFEDVDLDTEETKPENEISLNDEIEKLREENKKLKEALVQSGEVGKDSIAQKAIEDGNLDFDLSAFVYGSDDEKENAKSRLVAFLLGQLKEEAAPILQQRDEAVKFLDVQKAIKLLSEMEEDFPGYAQKRDAVEALISYDDVLKSYQNPLNQRIAGFLMQLGIETLEKNKKGTSVDELMDLYRNNQDFKTAIEKERLKKIEETGDVPVIPMDGGFSSATPYEAPAAPKTIKEANERVRKKFFK